MRTKPDHLGATDSDWFVVNSHPHKERVALDNLHRQEFRCYWPLVRKRVGVNGRVRDALRPLFNGYLFVQSEMDRRRWRPILSTYGVRSLVTCGADPSYVSHAFIEGLRQREVDGVVTRPPSPFQVGDRVAIGGGPFDGLIATIVELDDHERLIVLMQLLNRAVKVKLNARQVSLAAAA